MIPTAVRLVALAALLLSGIPSCRTQPLVMTGADRVVADRGFMFAGKRVGLVTNHTGVLSDGRFLVDALLDAGVRVTALFGPEHGIRGAAAAGETVTDSIDAESGVPVFSTGDRGSMPSVGPQPGRTGRSQLPGSGAPGAGSKRQVARAQAWPIYPRVNGIRPSSA